MEETHSWVNRSKDCGKEEAEQGGDGESLSRGYLGKEEGEEGGANCAPAAIGQSVRREPSRCDLLGGA